jgi:hypothetical protein
MLVFIDSRMTLWQQLQRLVTYLIVACLFHEYSGDGARSSQRSQCLSAGCADKHKLTVESSLKTAPRGVENIHTPCCCHCNKSGVTSDFSTLARSQLKFI